ncbi:MAG: apolipoprotein N-acyltransferase [Candidatus Zixiibacteriota bacterium]
MNRKSLYLTILSALLISLAYPPLPLGFVAYLCLVPLIIALESKSPFAAFKIGYIFGLISNSILLFWVGWATIGGTAAAIILLCLYPAILCWLHGLLQRRWKEGAVFFFPFLWVAMEYVRSLTQVSFPWLNLAYTQTYYLKLIQYASLWGNYAVTFWILWLNLIFYFLIRYRKKWKVALLLFVILMILPYIYGSWVMSEDVEGEEIKIAMLQGNMEPEIKWNQDLLDYNVRTYIDMSREAAKETVDFIIWPETAAPCYLAAESLYFALVQETCDELNVPLLVGTNDYQVNPQGKLNYFNSAFLFTPHGGYPKVYNKINLVPFSEKLPYDEVLGISDRIQFGQSDFCNGEDMTIFEIPQGRFATIICFESVYPGLVRDFVNRGTEFLVNITNDGWFGKTHGPFQHAQIAVFRAIENRIAIARCANTGVSMFIDPYGRVKQATKIWVRETVIGKIPLKREGNVSWSGRTFYARYGDWFAILCCLVSFTLTAVALLRRRVDNRRN